MNARAMFLRLYVVSAFRRTTFVGSGFSRGFLYVGSAFRRTYIAIALILLGLLASAQSSPSTRPVVYSAEVDSVIHPVSAEYMIETMDAADRAGAALVVFTLRTPGGLVDSTRDIVTRMLAAKTPIAVFVGPSGARAASAGFIITIAADVAAMAPGTHIGAAHPVSGDGQEVNETMAKKAASDVAAYTRTLAARRKRNIPFAEQAVTDSRAFTEQEALDASPPLIDLVASNVGELLEKLDGRTIARFDGTSVVVASRGAEVVPLEMSTRQRILSAVAQPNIAYLLLSLGMLGLTIELWSPGAIVPGVVGGLSLLLGLFALQLLPVNYAGLLLILLGLTLFALEIKITSYGLLTVAGVVSLLFGSLMLIDSSTPTLQLNLRFVLPVVVGFSAIGVLLVRLALAAHRQPSVTGVSGMIDEIGQAITLIEPGRPGHVATHGEIWQATASEPIPEGSRVRVTNVDGLTLTVRKE
jgi:membrane-bound serine protease (ClpP class)